MLKQVLVYRRDLKMGKGKLAVQCSHASLNAYRVARLLSNNCLQAWLEAGQKKVVLSVAGEEELRAVYNAAFNAGLPVCNVVDAGRTAFHGVTTNTCVGVGPASSAEIDKITGRTGSVETKLA